LPPAREDIGSAVATSDDLLTVKLRYKQPRATESRLFSFAVKPGDRALAEASSDFRFAAAVAGFGMLLRESSHCGAASFAMVLELAESGMGSDRAGHRAEFVQLVNEAQALTRNAAGISRRAL
jgi:Ca-activated chloride channel family protein